MRRDMDIAREILLSLEADESVNRPKTNIEIEGASADQISYHVKILSEAGLIEAIHATSMDSFAWWPVSLTWQGHEFLDTARDETRWNRAKKYITEKGGSMAFDVIKEVLMTLAKDAMK